MDARVRQQKTTRTEMKAHQIFTFNKDAIQSHYEAQNRELMCQSIEEMCLVSPSTPDTISPDVFSFSPTGLGSKTIDINHTGELSSDVLLRKPKPRTRHRESASSILSNLRVPGLRESLSSCSTVSDADMISVRYSHESCDIPMSPEGTDRHTQSNNDNSVSFDGYENYRSSQQPWSTHKTVTNGKEYPNVNDSFGQFMVLMSKTIKPRTGPSYWFGCEYRYMIVSERLRVKLIQSGRLPMYYDDNLYIFAKVRLSKSSKRGYKRIQLGRVGNKNQARVEVNFKEFSCADIIQQLLHLKLYLRNGLFGRSKKILDWSMPLDACHFLFPRTAWKNIESVDET